MATSLPLPRRNTKGPVGVSLLCSESHWGARWQEGRKSQLPSPDASFLFSSHQQPEYTLHTLKKKEIPTQDKTPIHLARDMFP